MGNMREKLESLNLATLKDLAKHRGVKGSSTMKKADLIEALLRAEGAEGSAQPAPAKSGAEQPPTEGAQQTPAPQPAPSYQKREGGHHHEDWGEQSAPPDAAPKGTPKDEPPLIQAPKEDFMW